MRPTEWPGCTRTRTFRSLWSGSCVGSDTTVLTSIEAGRANQAIPDADVFAFTVEDGRALLTLNRRDFIRLARSRPSHFGVIVCSEDLDFTGQAERIHRDIAAHQSLEGKLIRIRRPG